MVLIYSSVSAMLTSVYDKEMMKDVIMCSAVTALRHKMVRSLCSGSKYICCGY